MEIIVRQNDNRNRRIAKIVRQFESKPVVVDENCIQRLVEQLRRNRAFKLVEPNVEVDQLRQAKDHVRELSGEPVVAQVELEQNPQLPELFRQSAAESVAVDMKNS